MWKPNRKTRVFRLSFSETPRIVGRMTRSRALSLPTHALPAADAVVPVIGLLLLLLTLL